jgi:hypothetical protein
MSTVLKSPLQSDDMLFISRISLHEFPQDIRFLLSSSIPACTEKREERKKNKRGKEKSGECVWSALDTTMSKGKGDHQTYMLS